MANSGVQIYLSVFHRQSHKQEFHMRLFTLHYITLHYITLSSFSGGYPTFLHLVIFSSSFLGSTAQLRPWPPPQNPTEFLGGFSTIFFFYKVGLLAPRPTPMPEDQASVFISPRGRVATHFSCLLRHAWVTVGLFLFPGHHRES
jgi:hypothetical protein